LWKRRGVWHNFGVGTVSAEVAKRQTQRTQKCLRIPLNPSFLSQKAFIYRALNSFVTVRYLLKMSPLSLC
jgi:hypothetical protein